MQIIALQLIKILNSIHYLDSGQKVKAVLQEKLNICPCKAKNNNLEKEQGFSGDMTTYHLEVNKSINHQISEKQENMFWYWNLINI